MRKLISVVAVIGATALSLPAAAAPVIINPSFEIGSGNTIPGWSIVPTWFGAGSFWPASDGVQAVWMGATDTGGTDILSQTILGFTPGSSYTLTFDMVPENCDTCGRPGAYMHMDLLGADISVAKFEAHTALPTFFSTSPSNPWQAQSLTFMALAPSVTISMHGDISGGPSWEMGVDNFAVTAAIPEPETYAMLLAGLGLLGFAARRRKQKEAALA